MRNGRVSGERKESKKRQCAELGSNCGEVRSARIGPRANYNITNKIGASWRSKFRRVVARRPVEIRSFRAERPGRVSMLDCDVPRGTRLIGARSRESVRYLGGGTGGSHSIVEHKRWIVQLPGVPDTVSHAVAQRILDQFSGVRKPTVPNRGHREVRESFCSTWNNRGKICLNVRLFHVEQCYTRRPIARIICLVFGSEMDSIHSNSGASFP